MQSYACTLSVHTDTMTQDFFLMKVLKHSGKRRKCWYPHNGFISFYPSDLLKLKTVYDERLN